MTFEVIICSQNFFQESTTRTTTYGQKKHLGSLLMVLGLWTSISISGHPRKSNCRLYHYSLHIISFLPVHLHDIFFFRHNSDSGNCVKAKLENSEAVWSKTSCDDSTTKGVVCARRFNWEDIGNLQL